MPRGTTPRHLLPQHLRRDLQETMTSKKGARQSDWISRSSSPSHMGRVAGFKVKFASTSLLPRLLSPGRLVLIRCRGQSRAQAAHQAHNRPGTPIKTRLSRWHFHLQPTVNPRVPRASSSCFLSSSSSSCFLPTSMQGQT